MLFSLPSPFPQHFPWKGIKGYHFDTGNTIDIHFIVDQWVPLSSILSLICMRHCVPSVCSPFFTCSLTNKRNKRTCIPQGNCQIYDMLAAGVRTIIGNIDLNGFPMKYVTHLFLALPIYCITSFSVVEVIWYTYISIYNIFFFFYIFIIISFFWIFITEKLFILFAHLPPSPTSCQGNVLSKRIILWKYLFGALFYFLCTQLRTIKCHIYFWSCMLS